VVYGRSTRLLKTIEELLIFFPQAGINCLIISINFPVFVALPREPLCYTD